MSKQINQDRIEEVKKKCQMTLESDFVSGRYASVKCDRLAKFINPKPAMGIKYVCGIHARSLDAMYKRTGQTERCRPLISQLFTQSLEKPECEFTKGRPFTLLHQRKSQPLDTELREKCLLTHLEVATHYKKKHKLRHSLKVVEICTDYEGVKPLLEAQRNKALALLQQREQAELVGRFIELGWTPPDELRRKIEEAEKRGADSGIAAYESTCESLVVEAVKKEGERIFRELDGKWVVTKAGVGFVCLPVDEWQALKDAK